MSAAINAAASSEISNQTQVTAFMIILLLAAIVAGQVYEARVVRVIDGDTIRAVVIISEDEIVTSIRLRGVDSPELRGKCAEERELAHRAKAFVEELLPRNSRVSLSRVGPDRYYNKGKGRHLAEVQLADGRDLGRVLLGAGHARVWHGRGPRPDWCPSQ